MTTLPHDARKKLRGSIKNIATQRDALEYDLMTGRDPNENVNRVLTELLNTADPQAQLAGLVEAHDQMESSYMEQLLEMAPNDLTAYIEYMNPAEPPPDHIVWLAEHLEQVERREIMRLMVSMPPGHAKSVTCSRNFPSWYLGRNPNHKYLQGGHTQTFCENEFGKPTKALVDSERYREVFPDIKLSHDTKSAGTWALANNTGKYYTKGVGVGISGFRANAAAVDDPFASREDAESQTIRDKVFDWFSADFTTRLLPNSPMFIVATRWHSDDLCGRVEQMSKKGKGIPWIIINLPAICDSEDDPLHRALGEPLWKDFYTLDTLQNLRSTIPPRDWNSLYQGQPVDAGGGNIKVEWFQRYKDLPARNNRRRTIISVDSATKDNERSDFTAILVWIEDLYGNYYLGNVIRERLLFNDMTRKINSAALAWNADMILIEDKGSGTQYIQTRGGDECTVPIIPVKVAPNQSKTFRMDGAMPSIEAGMVYLPERADWLPEYEKEIASFPDGKYDDQCDATSQFLNYVREQVKGRTQKVSGMTHTNITGKQSRQKEKIMQQAEAALKLEMERKAQNDPIYKLLHDEADKIVKINQES